MSIFSRLFSDEKLTIGLVTKYPDLSKYPHLKVFTIEISLYPILTNLFSLVSIT